MWSYIHRSFVLYWRRRTSQWMWSYIHRSFVLYWRRRTSQWIWSYIHRSFVLYWEDEHRSECDHIYIEVLYCTGEDEHRSECDHIYIEVFLYITSDIFVLNRSIVYFIARYMANNNCEITGKPTWTRTALIYTVFINCRRHNTAMDTGTQPWTQEHRLDEFTRINTLNALCGLFPHWANNRKWCGPNWFRQWVWHHIELNLCHFNLWSRKYSFDIRIQNNLCTWIDKLL